MWRCGDQTLFGIVYKSPRFGLVLVFSPHETSAVWQKTEQPALLPKVLALR